MACTMSLLLTSTGKIEQKVFLLKEERTREPSNENYSSLANQHILTKTSLLLVAIKPNDKPLEGAASKLISRSTDWLSVAAINLVDINPEELGTKQREDPALNSCFEAVGKKVASRFAEIKFVLTNEILFQHYKLPSAMEMEQLALPSNL